MSLVYNNKKLFGKCSKFAIEKVQGTSPFVMLENFEPKQPQLNENQQIVIDLEMSECSVEVTGWHYPEELDTENLRYLFSDVLENARALEQEEE